MNKFFVGCVSALAGVVTATAITGSKMNKIACEKNTEKEKFRMMYHAVEKWMRLKQSGKNLSSYFEAYGYKKIAIYGVGDLGKLLINELEDTSITIEYAIDKNVESNEKIKVVKPDGDLSRVDAIVVTAIAYFDDINEDISKKVQCPIISLEDIIYEVV
ncbi:MAG: hypothetical protein ACI4KD_00650 [Oscillospiraceae bacterium]